MKRILVAAISLMAIGFISKADDRPVKFERIPAAAQKFVKNNFADKIEAFKAGVPMNLIPEKIKEYVTATYPEVYYREYEIDRGKHEVKLSNGLELTFNSVFTLIEVDD